MAGDELEDGLSYDVDFSQDEGVALENSESGDEVKAPVKNSKKRTKNPKLQEKKRLKMAMDIDQKRNLSTETSTEVIADYINDAIRRKNSDLSALELAELYFKKTDFRSTAEFEDPRTLDNLSGFITGRFKNMLNTKAPSEKTKEKAKLKEKKNKKKKEEVPEDPGQRKFVAIVSMSALRACDIHRSLTDIPGTSLKLINKNKLDVDLKLVKSTWSRVLCCTPGRLLKVLNSEDLELNKDEIKIVIVDNTYLDQKMQNIWNIQETTDALKEMAAAGSKIYLY